MRDIAKRKKIILIFIIVNAAVLLGITLLFLITAIISQPVPPTGTEEFIFDLRPLLYIFAGLFVILTIIELVLGYYIYKDKTWASITLLCRELITWIGLFATAAAIIQLAYSKE